VSWVNLGVHEVKLARAHAVVGVPNLLVV
jgi:hypothetical protein